MLDEKRENNAGLRETAEPSKEQKDSQRVRFGSEHGPEVGA